MPPHGDLSEKTNGEGAREISFWKCYLVRKLMWAVSASRFSVSATKCIESEVRIRRDLRLGSWIRFGWCCPQFSEGRGHRCRVLSSLTHIRCTKSEGVIINDYERWDKGREWRSLGGHFEDGHYANVGQAGKATVDVASENRKTLTGTRFHSTCDGEGGIYWLPTINFDIKF